MGHPIVVTNNESRFFRAEQVARMDVEAGIVPEPVRRDNAVAIAAPVARDRGEDDTVRLERGKGARENPAPSPLRS
ncbi:hypothetical protein DYI37_14705 [Fulvimarina endophytica]|uniref:Uncharacterized protein n=1 Tax=Fulvimarina endophytica TaxID=2293836 RepID=A0A371WZU5_9HYPH|nr:hypothetical protein [Fulvimarina endophytica]RFC62510.1 hypothetical protein DYI37_14705 [Fulvimarina endophytica]